MKITSWLQWSQHRVLRPYYLRNHFSPILLLAGAAAIIDVHLHHQIWPPNSPKIQRDSAEKPWECQQPQLGAQPAPQPEPWKFLGTAIPSFQRLLWQGKFPPQGQDLNINWEHKQFHIMGKKPNHSVCSNRWVLQLQLLHFIVSCWQSPGFIMLHKKPGAAGGLGFGEGKFGQPQCRASQGTTPQGHPWGLNQTKFMSPKFYFWYL